MKGKNDPTAFLSLKTELDGAVKCVKDKKNICLKTNKAMIIYKKGRTRWHS